MKAFGSNENGEQKFLNKVESDEYYEHDSLYTTLSKKGMDVVKLENVTIDNIVKNCVKAIRNPHVSNGHEPELSINKSKKTIEVYISNIYRGKAVRDYHAKQIQNKVRIITDVTYKVTFKTNRVEHVKAKDSMPHEFHNLVSYTLEKQVGSDVVSYKENSKTPYKDKNATYYAGLDYVHVNMNVADGLTLFGGNYLENTSLNGSRDQSGSEASYDTVQRFALGRIAYAQFINPYVTHVVFNEYTMILRTFKTIDLEKSDTYIKTWKYGDLK